MADALLLTIFERTRGCLKCQRMHFICIGRTGNSKCCEDDEMFDEDEADEMEGTGDDEAWHETEDNLPTKCLFCDKILDSAELCLGHCKDAHAFNVFYLKSSGQLDCFTFIKLINYIRKNRLSASECLRLLLGPTEPPWTADEYMIPVDNSDPLLQYDIEGAEEESQNGAEVAHPAGDGRENTVSMSLIEHRQLCKRALDAETRAAQDEEELVRVLQDLEKLRSRVGELVLSPVSGPSTRAPTTAVGGLTEEEDQAYFTSYAHYSIHEDMLKDKVRTEGYRDFLYGNGAMLKGKVVLDVGCGTGILSMFAARAGAKHVIAVDQSDIVYQAMDIIKENGLDDVITVKKGRLEDVDLPVEKVDVIVSEWMGYFLLFESMLDTVLYARNKYLSPEGTVYPDRCTMSIAGLDDSHMHSDHVTFWEDVYGFKMSCMKREVVREASVETVASDRLITKPCLLKDIDVCSAKPADLDFVSEMSLEVTRDGNLTALVGFFDVSFERGCEQKVKISTSPGSPNTHWKQTVFLLEKPVSVTQGQVLLGRLKCRKDRKDPRNLIIGVTLQGHTYTFYMQ